MSFVRSLTCVFLLTLLLTLFATLAASAQQITGNIHGSVTDPSGAVLPSAFVTARQVETGFTRTVNTDRDGNYLVVELPIGHYRIEVTAKGFQKYVQEGITLDVNESATVLVRLRVGSETQEVAVNADAVLIQNTVSSLGKTVMEREILDLPLDGRNFAQLGILQPGVVPLTPGLLEAGGGLRDSQGYAVDGQRPESNNFMIDGADNVNNVDGGFVIQPPIDAIAEFRILTHNSNAEFGRNTGSTTNIVTRSGSNSFHGAAWEFFRNDAMDGSDYFTRSVQPLKQNQFGATFGGPIKKDKTFFFVYYEGFRNRQGETDSATVPSIPERGGDFTRLCTSVGGQFNGGVCTDSAAIFYPTASFSACLRVRQSQFPTTRCRASIQPRKTFCPSFLCPTVDQTHSSLPKPRVETNDQFGVRLDHYLSAHDTLNFRYMFSRGPTTESRSLLPVPMFPGFPVGADYRAQNFVAQDTHVFSPTVIASPAFSYLRNKSLLRDPHEPRIARRSRLPVSTHSRHRCRASIHSGRRIRLRRRSHHRPAQHVPKHLRLLRFAELDPRQARIEIRRWIPPRQISALQGIATNGFFVFAPFPFTDGFASFLAGAPVFFLQGGGDFSRGIRGQATNAFAQDTYKLSQRVTLNLGLRYEMPSPNTEIHNRQNLFVPGAQSKVFPSAPPGLLYPGDPGVPGGLIPTDRKGFAPRVGFAWDPTGKSRLVSERRIRHLLRALLHRPGRPTAIPISAPPYLQTHRSAGPSRSQILISIGNLFKGRSPSR